MMDRQDDQPVRLASPSINVLDYRSVNLYELNYPRTAVAVLELSNHNVFKYVYPDQMINSPNCFL